MGKNFTTKTASIKATRADVRKLDAKEIKINGENILDKIKSSKTTVLDERGTNVTPYDLWGTRVETADDGTVTVYHELIDATTNKYAEEKNGWNFPYGLFERNMWHVGSVSSWVLDLCVLDTVEDYKWSLDNNVLYKDGAFAANIQTNMIENGDGMFEGESDSIYSRLYNFNSSLDNLKSGYSMFSYCDKLESFSSDLSSLTYGDYMFSYCYNLNSFSSDLSSLTNGYMMFYATSLNSFSSDLSSLTDGGNMFYGTGLESFSSDLSSLTSGYMMFSYCYNLNSFSSDLSSLTNGDRMFAYCKLDAKSVSNIVQSLPIGGEPYEENTYEITIGIGCNDTEEDRLLFAQECHCDTWQELLDEFSAKNWTVTFQYNGRPTTTYNMRRGETLPVFVKIEEVIMPTEGEKLRKPRYSHTSLDGSKFYRLTYFHSTNGSTDGYTQFNSIEEAEQTFEITPKQQIEK